MDSLPYESLKNPPPRYLFLRFMKKVNIPRGNHDKCWEWKAGTSKGYGNFVLPAKVSNTGKRLCRGSHRLIMTWLHGEIDSNMDVDHRKCNNRKCCRPSHLKICTRKENVVREGSDAPAAKWASRTHCIQGHPLIEGNLSIYKLPSRHCLTCERKRGRDKDARKRKAQGLPERRSYKHKEVNTKNASP